LPIILKGHGLSNWAIGFTSAVPYVCATIGMLFWARHVDRGGSKTGNLAVSCFLAAAGLLTSVLAGSFIPSFIGLTFALMGVTAARAIFWTIPAGFLSGVAAAGGLAFINSVGALGGFVGPVTIGWLKDTTGSFNTGLVVLTCLGMISAILTLSLRRLIRQE
jgi:MFS transporter, ACS family, tartrate transporter